ncbi:thrombospondin type 3 repeat-containing protein [Desulfovibrio inopinatus]|uniref:thrombospondin type 3 repeat-containing protein n=1 Tax=Desulfovibrio inopinatus TaxID=102109 RepID=UPI00041E4838|nr:thrombospondin type 3 repeat-containing protein [Desulfovibrio inopinatus]
MIRRRILSWLVACGIVLNAGIACADFPDVPSGTIPLHIKGYITTQYESDVYIWRDTSENMYIRYDPTTSKFYIGLSDWTAAQDDKTCMMYTIDEYGFNFYQYITSSVTTFFKPSSSYCGINFNNPFSLRYDDGTVFQYPSDFGSSGPDEPICTCDDTDSDGVPDAWDECPLTPAGSLVDETGCPGTMSVIDSDNDGVQDCWDQCPDTPTGSLVDAIGCPGTTQVVDSDGDGVQDNWDRCTDTPEGSLVDATGCPGSTQIADSDNDGVQDGWDQCADTPTGSLVDSVGCPGTTQVSDADNDGVPDTWDQCADTPAKSLVDSTGCPGTPETDLMIVPMVITK